MVESIENLQNNQIIDCSQDYKGRITELFSYPLKSGYPIKTDKLKITNSGVNNDRVFLVYNTTTKKVITIQESGKIFYIKCKEVDHNENKDEVKDKETDHVTYLISIPDTTEILSKEKMENSIQYKDFKIKVPKIPNTTNNNNDINNENSNTIDTINTNNNIENFPSQIQEILLFKIPRKVIFIEDDSLTEALNIYLQSNSKIKLAYCVEKKPTYEVSGKRQKQLENHTKEKSINTLHNLAPFHIISTNDLILLNKKLSEHNVKERSSFTFRPNIVVNLKENLIENIDFLYINGVKFKRLIKCIRCKLICFDYELGKKNPDTEPLNTLSDYKFDDKLLGSSFGAYFCLDDDCFEDSGKEIILRVGDDVVVNYKSLENEDTKL